MLRKLIALKVKAFLLEKILKLLLKLAIIKFKKVKNELLKQNSISKCKKGYFQPCQRKFY